MFTPAEHDDNKIPRAPETTAPIKFTPLTPGRRLSLWWERTVSKPVGEFINSLSETTPSPKKTHYDQLLEQAMKRQGNNQATAEELEKMYPLLRRSKLVTLFEKLVQDENAINTEDRLAAIKEIRHAITDAQKNGNEAYFNDHYQELTNLVNEFSAFDRYARSIFKISQTQSSIPNRDEIISQMLHAVTFTYRRQSDDLFTKYSQARTSIERDHDPDGFVALDNYVQQFINEVDTLAQNPVLTNLPLPERDRTLNQYRQAATSAYQLHNIDQAPPHRDALHRLRDNDFTEFKAMDHNIAEKIKVLNTIGARQDHPLLTERNEMLNAVHGEFTALYNNDGRSYQDKSNFAYAYNLDNMRRINDSIASLNDIVGESPHAMWTKITGYLLDDCRKIYQDRDFSNAAHDRISKNRKAIISAKPHLLKFADAVEKLRAYGNKHKEGSKKRKAVTELLTSLDEEVENYFKDFNFTENSTEAFIRNAQKAIEHASEQLDMNKDLRILLNVAIGLIPVIGWAALAGKAIRTKVKTGHARLFGHRRCTEHLDVIDVNLADAAESCELNGRAAAAA